MTITHGQGAGRALVSLRYAAILLLVAAVPFAAAEGRFVSRLALASGQTVVIAEVDFEARSIGSFSVRLYEAAAAADATTFFLAGLILPRDGVVESVTPADVNGDGREDVVVVTRSVGTGSYLGAHAIAVGSEELQELISMDGLAPDTDPVSALQEAWRAR